MGAGVLRVAPLPGETTWSLPCRIATRYAMAPGDLLPGWQWANARPQGPGGATRPDAEVLLNRAGQRAGRRLHGRDGVSIALQRALYRRSVCCRNCRPALASFSSFSSSTPKFTR
ncbi:MAG: DNA-binding protein [Frankiales bacterium]|nr:DNA-binding protein [Frankiales bacterium]